MSEARSSILRQTITGSDTVDDARGELADIGSIGVRTLGVLLPVKIPTLVMINAISGLWRAIGTCK